MSKNWAICIGINDYYNLQPLNYAVQDAESVRDFFLGEVQFEQVFYFADDAPAIKTPRGSMRALPTYANLKRFFRERFQKSFLSVGDNFWFFFAGHGELHGGHDYLMPIDVDPGNVEETALRISDITAYLRNSGADNTVLLLDACRSQGRRAPVGVGTEEQQGMITIYSCSPRESSYEVEDLGHGVFTHALLEGLRLQGSSSCATVQRLDQYLRHQVPQVSGLYGKPVQTPYTAVEPLSKNCLILLPQRARLEDVQALKNAAFRAETKNEFDFAQQLWMRVLAASRVDQDAIEALQRIAVRRVQQSSEGATAAPITAGSRSITDSMADSTAQPVAQASRKTSFQQVPSFEFEVVTVDAKGNVTQREQKRAEFRREELINLDLVRVPGGTFTMGSPTSEAGRDWYGDFDDALRGVNVEGPQHRVTLQSFFLGKYPVTQAQWRTVAALPKIEHNLEPDPSNFKGDNLPVEQVTWDEAVEFCNRLSTKTKRKYRLPSEAEWEYACRARSTTPFHFGHTITTDLANYVGTDYEYQGKTYSGSYGQGPKGEYRKNTTNVGSFPANAFGLYDMHGNVWEWCLDHWHKNYDGAPTDGKAWLSPDDNVLRLLRGGSWLTIPDYCRSASRDGVARVDRYNAVGFRVVCVSSWTL